jgi:hypothetical protein
MGAASDNAHSADRGGGNARQNRAHASYRLYDGRTGFSKANGLPADIPGMTAPVTDAKAAGERIFRNIPAWAPAVPAPIDVKSVNWATDRYHANWDGNLRDTPRRVAEGTNGYKADVLHGVWAQAPYLHNGSVPTLGQLICPTARPQRFLRGNMHYDEALVGFEWSDRPKARYGPHDTMLIKEYDTSVPGKANTGHTFGSDLCPDTSGLDPVSDRKEIEPRILKSPVGALLAYLETL